LTGTELANSRSKQPKKILPKVFYVEILIIKFRYIEDSNL